jgi:hypothetical protein
MTVPLPPIATAGIQVEGFEHRHCLWLCQRPIRRAQASSSLANLDEVTTAENYKVGSRSERNCCVSERDDLFVRAIVKNLPESFPKFGHILTTLTSASLKLRIVA